VVGIVIGALIVGLYCLFGGIRASIWTDAMQSVVMLGSMSVLLFVAMSQTGGFSGLWSSLAAIDPQLTNPIPPNLKFGFAIYLVSWITAGIGVCGQPHVMVRAMAIDKPEHIGLARRVYVVWYSLFSAAAIAVGLASRVLLSSSSEFDAELALPLLSSELLPPVLVAFVLAGLFASTMSTADSQILSCSAALTQDLFPRWRQSYTMAKLGTVLMTAIVLVIAVAGSGSVFFLVVLAWSALASTLGPLLVVRAFRWPVDTWTALGMILAGLGVCSAGATDSAYPTPFTKCSPEWPVDLVSTYS